MQNGFKTRASGKQSNCHWLLEMFLCHGEALDYQLFWIVHKFYCAPSTRSNLVQDDPKLLNDGGEIPKSQ